MDRKAARGALSTQLTLFDSRFIRLGPRFVEYRFRRRPRRSLRITVDADGLSVSAPLRSPWRVIEAFLRQKEAWILARLEEWARVPRARRLRVESGESVPVLGATLELEVREAGRAAVRREGERLLVLAPGPRRARQALQRWLKEHALAHLVPRAAHYAARLERPAPRVRLSSARTQWGACSEAGAIRLNWRLVHLAPELADYVVAHEVAHLVEMNHSKRFWAVLASLYPAWREAREQLELAGASIPTISEAA
jgi:predicted metal-dependent hydrolase